MAGRRGIRAWGRARTRLAVVVPSLIVAGMAVAVPRCSRALLQFASGLTQHLLAGHLPLLDL